MTLSIGENIKRLRTEREITQDNLARHLGVTSRAVSKWEVGRAYPDITLLPGLASYFGVSLDELMSMDAERQTQRANEMLAQAASNQALGKITENVKYLRKAVSQFPGDYRFQVMLASMLVAEYAVERDHLTERDGDRPEIRENYLEAAEYLERVLKFCKDDSLRSTAKLVLMTVYEYLKERDKEAEIFAQIPVVALSQAVVIPSFLPPEELETTLCVRVANLTELLCITVMALSGASDAIDIPRQDNAERMYFLQKTVSLLELVYDDGGFGKAASYMHSTYLAMARLHGDDGDLDGALNCLEKAADFADRYMNRPQLMAEGLSYTPYSAPLVRKHRDYFLLGANMSEENTAALFLSVSLPKEKYAKLRALLEGNERYNAVISRFEALRDKDNEARERMGSMLFDSELIKQAAANGDSNAAISLASMHLLGILGVKQDLGETVKWLRVAAELGNTTGLNDLGEYYVLGKGVERDYGEAMRLFLKAEEVPNPFGKGNPFARWNIGELYYEGLGVERDDEAALKWFRLAADYGFPMGHFRLGEFYENGIAVEPDLDKALEYYKLAASPSDAFKSAPSENVPAVSGGFVDYDAAAVAEAIARVEAKLRGN